MFPFFSRGFPWYLHVSIDQIFFTVTMRQVLICTYWPGLFCLVHAWHKIFLNKNKSLIYFLSSFLYLWMTLHYSFLKCVKIFLAFHHMEIQLPTRSGVISVPILKSTLGFFFSTFPALTIIVKFVLHIYQWLSFYYSRVMLYWQILVCVRRELKAWVQQLHSVALLR